jgi:hypothetical protein
MLNLAKTITPQKQPSQVSCLATCVGMSVGVPVNEIGVDLTKPCPLELLAVWLAERGVWLRCGVWNSGRGEELIPGGIYLAIVRSSNIVGVDHAILVDTRTDPFGIFDPQLGKIDGLDKTKITAIYEFFDRNLIEQCMVS